MGLALMFLLGLFVGFVFTLVAIDVHRLTHFHREENR